MSIRILVMDDEETICRLMGLILTRLGFECVAVPNGEEALKRHGEALRTEAPFAAVILDLNVREGMGGAETLEALRAVDPDVVAITMSGTREALPGVKAVIGKPFRMADVEAALKQALTPQAGAPSAP